MQKKKIDKQMHFFNIKLGYHKTALSHTGFGSGEGPAASAAALVFHRCHSTLGTLENRYKGIV